jgi:hypothetical protein
MKKVLFVYNADSGLLNFVLDAAHKLFAPSTYPCNLCALTYTPSGLSRWRRFVKTLPYSVEFLHRDELAEQYGAVDSPLPAAFLWDGRSLQPWISAEEMNGYQTLTDLMAVVEQRSAILT